MNCYVKHVLFLLTFLIFEFFTNAQKDIKKESEIGQNPLEINDHVPDIVLKNFFNYPLKSVNLSIFSRNKLLIIDFWSVNCQSCIEAFPKLIALQKEFKDQLQILLVTYQPNSIIKRFIEKRRKLTGLNMSLPLICSDTFLRKLFWHQYVPHYVWIDESRIVRYITYGDDVSEKNISAVLKNEPISMNLKDDCEIGYDPVKPLFINGYAGNGEQLVWSSTLSKYIKGMPTVFGIAKDSGRSIALIYNCPIKAMFQSAYNDISDNSYYIPNNRTVLQVKDTNKYNWVVNGVMQWDNLWCYQLIAPTMSTIELRKLMQSDLERYFRLNAHIETRKTKCWVLTIDDTAKIQSKGGKVIDNYDLTNFKLTMVNVPIIQMRIRFIYHLLEHSPFPFVDETGYSGNVDIRLEDIKIDDLESMAKALNKYQMKLQLKEREVNFLIIRESK